MVQKNIVCEGLRCCVHSKAAFIDWCMESSKEWQRRIFRVIANGQCCEKEHTVEPGTEGACI